MAENPTMQWAVELAGDAGDALAALRLQPGLQVLGCRDGFWLAGSSAEDVSSRWLACLPCKARYACDDQGRLVPLGGRVPVGRLPAGDWQPISMFFVPDAPASLLPGRLVRQCRIALRPATDPREGGAILTDPAALLPWVETASAVRLAALRFAICEDHRILLVGTPIPPVRGREYSLHRGILLPAGHAFDPPVLRDIAPGLLSLAEEDLALFHPDGGSEWIRGADFVPATRSALRLSLGARS